MSEDNLEPLITQCPNCETRFRVTESQLQVAQGRVRCGACLGVFDGTAHLSLDGEELQGSQEPDDVDRLLEELEAVTVVQGEAGGSRAVTPATLEGPEQPLDAQGSGTGEASAAGDEAQLPGDLLALEAQLMEELRCAQDDAEMPVAADPEPQDQDGDAQAAEQPGADEGVKEQPGKEEPGKEEPGKEEPEKKEPAEEDRLSPEQKAKRQQAVQVPATSAEITRLKIPEPVLPELEEIPETHSGPSWFTIVLILVALIALPAQVLWFQYESWVKDGRFRPVYQSFCDLAGCELPAMRDVAAIVSKKSVIRVHPERSDARIIDVLMVNNADFAQPFPMIELMATTIRGQLVAGRRFKPQEYLQGDLADARLMPPRTPVHVSLEIQDPGQEALNFEVRFR